MNIWRNKLDADQPQGDPLPGKQSPRPIIHVEALPRQYPRLSEAGHSTRTLTL
jgi:hypothetical protein